MLITAGLMFKQHNLIRAMHEQGLAPEHMAQAIPCTLELVKDSLKRQNLAQPKVAVDPLKKRSNKPKAGMETR